MGCGFVGGSGLCGIAVGFYCALWAFPWRGVACLLSAWFGVVILSSFGDFLGGLVWCRGGII